MKQTPTFDIEATAVQKAIDHLLAVRPDLNRADTIALAKLVATTAASETTKGLRDAGHMWPQATPHTGAAPGPDAHYRTHTASTDRTSANFDALVMPLIQGLVTGFAQGKWNEKK